MWTMKKTELWPEHIKGCIQLQVHCNVRLHFVIDHRAIALHTGMHLVLLY